MKKHKTVSQNMCYHCYWFLTTHNGEKLCLIAYDENKPLLPNNYCDEKVYSKDEALRKIVL